MKGSLQRLAEGILFGGNVLLLFFLLFESYIHLPLWLQPVGRMHPLVLHFPIAFLFLILIVEFIRFRKEFQHQRFFQEVVAGLFLITALLTLMAALMGLFLSLEEGYSGETLTWHKWGGAGLVFLVSLLYFTRNAAWFKEGMAKVGVVLAVICLVFASHFGATLTHGENFVFAPIAEARKVNVSLDEALVFDHLVMPVLEKRCNSCHNPRKSKGELAMNTKELLLKGGKSGALFVPGDPDNSLMLHRIHLPLDDEEHMPPSGKTQLAEEEKRVLELWIREDAVLNTKVVDLQPDHELFILASNVFKPAGLETSYAFPKADVAVVKRLNHSFRVVEPLAKESPALHATLFPSGSYDPEELADLMEIRQQVVYLNLNKVPVRDEELKMISQFENLEKLNLNFSEISGKGLQALTGLENLKHLSIAGTKVSREGISEFLKHTRSTFETITLWDTPLGKDEIEYLRKEFKSVDFEAGREDEDLLQLNLPVLANESSIFSDTLVLKLGHPIRDVDIRFTMDGSEPDSINSPLYKYGETILKEGKVIKAKAYKEGWYGSDRATIQVYQNRHMPDSVHLLSRLNRVHPANGNKTFFDGEMGSFNANSPAWANNWAGFLRNDMELLLEYKTPVTVSNISMRVLVEPETVIFPPASIEIWGGDDPDRLKLLRQMKPTQPTKEGKPYIELITCEIKPYQGTYFKVVAKPVEKIPDWSRRKGGAALLLVDEMFVN